MTEQSNNQPNDHEGKADNSQIPDGIAHIDNTDYEIGQDNIRTLGMDIHNPVFVISAGVVLLFVLFSLIFTADAKALLEGSKAWSIDNFDWLFMISANVFLIFCIALIFSPFGKIRFGGNDAKADFSYLSWLAMLFAAGMGIGLMFWGTAEPVAYFTNYWGTPLGVTEKTPEAAELAMAATMYHWGFHAWAIYAVVCRYPSARRFIRCWVSVCGVGQVI